MRADIKEEDVKEIYNRCEEHRRLWNETEIIYNSNYAIGEVIIFCVHPIESTMIEYDLEDNLIIFLFIYLFFSPFGNTRTMYVKKTKNNIFQSFFVSVVFYFLFC